jgi:nucleotide-binding universal stress UspA family protein
MGLGRVDIHQEERQTDRKVVILVDENSQYLIDWVLGNLDPTHKVVLVNRRSELDTNPSYAPYLEIFGYDHDIHERMQALHKDKAHHLVKYLGRQLVTKGIPCELYTFVGDTQQMLNAAQELHPDFIIVGCRKQLKILGSTSKLVLAHSSLPVMLIKEQ